jgi:hypothetical protein
MEAMKKSKFKSNGFECCRTDMILIKEGIQCANCLAYSKDNGKTWELPNK